MSEVNHNPFNLKEGQRVIVDKGYRNSSEATIIRFTPNRMFATVKSDDGYEWETMTYRLTPKSSE